MEIQNAEHAREILSSVCWWLGTQASDDTLDVEAVKWAIDILEKQPALQENSNYQFWLRRLASLVPGYRNYPPLTDAQMVEVMNSGGRGAEYIKAPY